MMDWLNNKVSVPAEADGDDVKTGFTMTFDAWAIQAVNGTDANGDKTYFTAKEAWDKVGSN